MIRNAVPSCLFRDVLFRVKFVLFSSLLALLLQQLLLLQCCNSFHVHQFNLPTTDRINGNLGKESLLYLDNDLIVMNKPHDVQSAPGLIESESLATRVADLFHINRIDQMIVHRLDMATSGIIVYARNVEALANLHKQFRRRKEIYKLYSAVVAGVLPTLEGEISLPIGRDEVRGSPFQAIDPDGKQSVTYWNVRQVGDNCTHLNLRPITGRTHQLRIHLSAIGHPILGDTFYAAGEALKVSDRLLLHAEELRLKHPRTNEGIRFYSPSPFHV